MDSLYSLLQEEVSYLRELLSNLSLEEQMILSGSEKEKESIREERKNLKLKLRAVRKKKKGLVEEDPLEVTSLLEQISSLEVKIKEKKEANRSLAKMKRYQMPAPQKQKPAVKKKPLLLEEDSN